MYDRPSPPDPGIERLVTADISSTSGMRPDDLSLLRAKAGVYVYRCTYGGAPAIVKYFERESDRREILNYRLLMKSRIPTMRVLAFGKASLVMEDGATSADWRLGTAEDMRDPEVAVSLARWYFDLHERGSRIPELDTLYCEYDGVTEEKLKALCDRLPGAADTFSFILVRYRKLRELIDSVRCTLTYNDFHWTNCLVRKDKQAALMFDYQLLGRGYRYADLRNVAALLSRDAYKAFADEYARLYVLEHGRRRTDEESKERTIYNVAAVLFELVSAYELERFPSWAIEAKARALSGRLLVDARRLLQNKSQDEERCR
jgi:hypothetical protein